MTDYLVKNGINYPSAPGAEEVRQEPGAVVVDMPVEFEAGYVEHGDIEVNVPPPPPDPPPADAEAEGTGITRRVRKAPG